MLETGQWLELRTGLKLGSITVSVIFPVRFTFGLRVRVMVTYWN